jgi:hypothetical protein
MTSRKIFWLLVVATLGVYATMLLWSIPAISSEAGGLRIFDMRPAGYSFSEAHAFLSALTSEGERLYESIQLRLDIFYPAMLAVTAGWAMILLVPAWRWRPVLALVPVPGMVFDYLENGAVKSMLAAGADGLSPELVAQASMYSRMKAGTTTVSLVLLCLLLIFWAINRRKRRAN